MKLEYKSSTTIKILKLQLDYERDGLKLIQDNPIVGRQYLILLCDWIGPFLHCVPPFYKLFLFSYCFFLHDRMFMVTSAYLSSMLESITTLPHISYSWFSCFLAFLFLLSYVAIHSKSLIVPHFFSRPLLKHQMYFLGINIGIWLLHLLFFLSEISSSSLMSLSHGFI